MPFDIPTIAPGTNMTAAFAALTGTPGLTIAMPLLDEHSPHPFGTFLRTDPPGGTTGVADGTLVNVYSSLGPIIAPPPPGTVEVIKLVGEYVDDLTILQWVLDNAITMNVTLVDHAHYDHGMIIGASLLPPAHVTKGTGTIDITVVRPAPAPTAPPTGTLVRLPNGRVGRPRPWTPESVRGMTKEVGLQQLRTNGIDFDVEEFTDESLTADDVIQTVVLDVGTGRYRVRVGRWPWLKRFWEKR